MKYRLTALCLALAIAVGTGPAAWAQEAAADSVVVPDAVFDVVPDSTSAADDTPAPESGPQESTPASDALPDTVPEQAPAADDAVQAPAVQAPAAETVQAPADTDALENAATGDALDQFITNFYTTILGRQPDADGLAYYRTRLTSRVMTGADMIQGFLNSPEYQAKNKEDAAFINDAYSAALGRAPEASGLQYYLDVLAKGVSRLYVLRNFVASDEFAGKCAAAGVSTGSITLTEPRDQNENLAAFITRAYSVILGRNPDVDGLNYYARNLLANTYGGAQMVFNFFHSQEYQNRGVSDTQYVTDVYTAMMGRSPDAKGLQYYLNYLNNGVSRDHTVYCFSNSSEFKAMCTKAGIGPGSISLSESRDRYGDRTMMVMTLYRGLLGRDASAAELNQWCDNVEKNKLTTADVAWSVYKQSSLNNVVIYGAENWVTKMYSTFIGTTQVPDNVRTDWINAFKQYSGTQLEKFVTGSFNFFVHSNEFAGKYARFCTLKTGWVQDKGSAYIYLNANGVMLTGLQTIGGSVYYLDPHTGRRATGWVTISGQRMYFDSQGRYTPGALEEIARGVDVSEHQGSVDWPKVKAAGYSFAILRAVTYKDVNGQKVPVVDPTFVENVRWAQAAGVQVGAYCYTYADTTADMQKEINVLISALNTARASTIPGTSQYCKIEYPVFWDVESNTYLNKLNVTQRTELTRQALILIEQNGYYPGLYTYKNYLTGGNLDLNSGGANALKNYDLWLAEYNGQDKYTYTGSPVSMWQKTSSATVNGITGKADVNICYKDYPTVIRNAKKNYLS